MAEYNESEQFNIRKEKLEALQADGKNPYVITKFEQDAFSEDLKAEFEKRNPTQTEKLNLRSLDSYPFKIKPTDYWADKSNSSNYSAYSDNDEPTTHEYVITNDDVDDFSEREIADSFASLDDSINQDIKRIFGLA
ncbi:MAG: hypothetical protein IK069_02675 [Firmicutes bacterium]|nr:hypothetical protein [Bacillota bacterium]